MTDDRKAALALARANVARDRAAAMWEHKPAPIAYNGNRRYSGLHLNRYKGAAKHRPLKLKPKREAATVGDPIDKISMFSAAERARLEIRRTQKPGPKRLYLPKP